MAVVFDSWLDGQVTLDVHHYVQFVPVCSVTVDLWERAVFSCACESCKLAVVHDRIFLTR